MTQPLVCCVMLTADRPAMTARAVKCFLAQTYERKSLVIFDSGKQQYVPFLSGREITWVEADEFRGSTIGALRNAANELAPGAHIIVHWDSDDWSHPSRVSDQVALLQSSGADCVGYNELLFWKEQGGEAWRYSNRNPAMPVGASLCYRRATWKRQPFKDTHVGEDRDFCQRVDCKAVSAITDAPRLIQSLHGGNTWDGDIEAAIRDASSSEWHRTEHWDNWVRGVMKL